MATECYRDESLATGQIETCVDEGLPQGQRASFTPGRT